MWRNFKLIFPFFLLKFSFLQRRSFWLSKAWASLSKFFLKIEFLMIHPNAYSACVRLHICIYLALNAGKTSFCFHKTNSKFIMVMNSNNINSNTKTDMPEFVCIRLSFGFSDFSWVCAFTYGQHNSSENLRMSYAPLRALSWRLLKLNFRLDWIGLNWIGLQSLCNVSCVRMSLLLCVRASVFVWAV